MCSLLNQDKFLLGAGYNYSNASAMLNQICRWRHLITHEFVLIRSHPSAAELGHIHRRFGGSRTHLMQAHLNFNLRIHHRLP